MISLVTVGPCASKPLTPVMLPPMLPISVARRPSTPGALSMRTLRVIEKAEVGTAIPTMVGPWPRRRRIWPLSVLEFPLGEGPLGPSRHGHCTRTGDDLADHD